MSDTVALLLAVAAITVAVLVICRWLTAWTLRRERRAQRAQLLRWRSDDLVSLTHWADYAGDPTREEIAEMLRARVRWIDQRLASLDALEGKVQP